MSAVESAAASCVCGSDHLCACGCGEELNPNLRRVHELIAAGCTHQRAADIIGVTRACVSVLFRNPPRYVKGHLSAEQRETGRLRQLATNVKLREARRLADERHCARITAARELRRKEMWARREAEANAAIARREERSREMSERTIYCLQAQRFFRAVAYVARKEYWRIEREARAAMHEEERAFRREAKERLRLWRREAEQRRRVRACRERELARAEQRRLREGWRRFVRAVAVAARCELQKLDKGWRRFVRAVAVAARCELLRLRREGRMTDKWTRWAVREQRREMAKKDKAQRSLQRQVDSEANRGEVSVLFAAVSLDAPPEYDEGMARGESPALARVPSAEDELVGEETTARLQALLGDLGPDDVARMTQWDLDRLQARLAAEGFAPRGIQQAERKRLREPNRHSGATLAKSGGKGGGRRTRAQQSQVTREHNVREMDNASKKAHRALRQARA